MNRKRTKVGEVSVGMVVLGALLAAPALGAGNPRSGGVAQAAPGAPALPGEDRFGEDHGQTEGVGALRVAGERFGMRVGDKLLEINGEPVTSIESAHRLFTDDPKVEEVTVLREGKRVRLRPQASGS